MIQLQYLNRILDSQDISLIVENNLNTDYFSDYLQEFNFIKYHIDTYSKVPDTTTFLAKFPSFDIIKVNETNQYLLSELIRDKNDRNIAKTFNQVKDLLLNGKSDEAKQLFINSAETLTQTQSLKCVDIIHDTSRYNAYVDRTEDYSKYYIKTGFPELDIIINGWDRQEELATIVARTGSAKTWILLKSAIAAAQQGLAVGIYSGEMSESKVGYRVDTLLGHISNRKLSHGDIEIQTEYKQYIDNISSMITGSIKILTPALINGLAGVSALRAFVEKEHLDILFIDQHSLLEDDRKAHSPVEKASNISKDLKNLQVVKKIPIIAVSQQNRSSTENGLDTTMIAQADRIGQDSTTILFLEKKDELLTIHLVKSRDHESGKKLQYALDLDKGIFTYIPEGCDEDNESTSEIPTSSEYIDVSTNQGDIF